MISTHSWTMLSSEDGKSGVIGDSNLVDCSLCCSCFICPLPVAIDGRRCFAIKEVVRPGHVVKFPFWMAAINVAFVGQPAAA